MHGLVKSYYIFTLLGPRFVALRLGLALRKRLGTARRRFAPRPWEALGLGDVLAPGVPAGLNEWVGHKRANPPPFLFALGRPPALPQYIRDGPHTRRPALAERLRLAAQDRCVYFFRTPAPGRVDWYANPFDGTRSDPAPTWVDIPDYLPQQGDPRTLWEPARAAWALDFARARPHGLEINGAPPNVTAPNVAELYWRWVDSWMAACPPFRGFQWKCGQESAVRFIAIALGFWSLANDPLTTPQRWRQFARLAWATGYRIAHYIDYAISQKNNHAMSEAGGLMLVAQLFPEFREAARWWRTGRDVLAREIRRQCYADGSYLQHSMNYQRVMLAGAALALRLAELRGEPFARDIYDRLGACGEFLFQLLDPDTGQLPMFGNNDGAQVLPLNECDFLDFRPVVQAAHYLVHRERLLPPGPWDEDLLWLFGPEALENPLCPRVPESRAFDVGGYYTIRREHSWALVRCHTYRDRPGQYDQLHVDLWHRGQNILRGCGTYKYYVPGRPELESYFKSIRAHNCLEIDGRAPVEHVSRFLYFPWPRGAAQKLDGPGSAHILGESFDYSRAPWRVVHRRTVLSLPDDVWVIVDDLHGGGTHTATVRWHLLDGPVDFDPRPPAALLHTPAGAYGISVLSLAGPADAQIVRGRDQPGRVLGFAAPYYGELLPIPVLEATFRSALPLRIVTTLSPGRVLVPDLAEFGGADVPASRIQLASLGTSAGRPAAASRHRSPA